MAANPYEPPKEVEPLSDVPRFEPGDRVLMLKHGDWMQDASGTISCAGFVRYAARGVEYVIVFDHPQSDLTDELNGDHLRTYSSSTVQERYLQSLGTKGPIPNSQINPATIAMIQRQLQNAIAKKNDPSTMPNDGAP